MNHYALFKKKLNQMEQKSIKSKISKKTSFVNKKNKGLGLDEVNTEIRLGISLADEKANQELKKRKIDAPLSTEEKIFLRKNVKD
jgi:hypothetical protein